MKKLYALIQTLLTMLSQANKEILKLRRYIDVLNEGCEDAGKLITQWYNLYLKTRKERDMYDKWFQKACLQHWESEMKRLELTNIFHDQLEELWQEEMNEKYSDLPEEDTQWMWECDMKSWADELQHKEDKEYVQWVVKELDLKDYDPCDFCDVWQEPEACCICRMFNEER